MLRWRGVQRHATMRVRRAWEDLYGRGDDVQSGSVQFRKLLRAGRAWKMLHYQNSHIRLPPVKRPFFLYRVFGF